MQNQQPRERTERLVPCGPDISKYASCLPGDAAQIIKERAGVFGQKNRAVILQQRDARHSICIQCFERQCQDVSFGVVRKAEAVGRSGWHKQRRRPGRTVSCFRQRDFDASRLKQEELGQMFVPVKSDCPIMWCAPFPDAFAVYRVPGRTREKISI